jgi:hypothetical protein
MMGRLAMLIGLFGVPVVLLWAGHHWRHRSARIRGAFWGGLIAHTIAALLATAAGVFWPSEWDSDDAVRGFFGFWSMLLMFIAGALTGALVNGPSNETPARDIP